MFLFTMIMLVVVFIIKVLFNYFTETGNCSQLHVSAMGARIDKVLSVPLATVVDV